MLPINIRYTALSEILIKIQKEFRRSESPKDLERSKRTIKRISTKPKWSAFHKENPWSKLRRSKALNFCRHQKTESWTHGIAWQTVLWKGSFLSCYRSFEIRFVDPMFLTPYRSSEIRFVGNQYFLSCYRSSEIRFVGIQCFCVLLSIVRNSFCGMARSYRHVKILERIKKATSNLYAINTKIFWFRTIYWILFCKSTQCHRQAASYPNDSRTTESWT